MARISGVDIPKQKRGVIALTYIFGIGKSRAQSILETAKVDETRKFLNGLMMKQDVFVKWLGPSKLKVNYVQRSN